MERAIARGPRETSFAPWLTVALAGTLIACGGGADGGRALDAGTADAGTHDATDPIDAATTIDAAGDLDAATEPLLGTWVRVPVVGPDGVERLTFSAGRRWAAEGTFGTDSGTYLLDGDWLTIQRGQRWQYEGRFLLIGDQLMIKPYLPSGAPVGIVGTWTASYATSAIVSERLVVEAGGAASITTTIRGTPTTATGTWTQAPRGFVVDLGATPGSPFHFRTMGGDAVGTQLFERAP